MIKTREFSLIAFSKIRFAGPLSMSIVMGMLGNATRLRMIAQGIVVFLIDSVITIRFLCFPFAVSSEQTDFYDLFYKITFVKSCYQNNIKTLF